MHAAWYEQQGPAEDVLHIGDMEKPSPGPGEVLVRVCTSGVKPLGYEAPQRLPGTTYGLFSHYPA